MAAKSDFAQKLLNDLRLRKERMGASQGSSRNHAMARDAYRDPGNLQRGSRHTKSLGGSKSSNQQLVPSGGSQQQIVTYTGRQHQRSESMGDLSMAFTYAVKHGGKLLNVDFSNASNTNTMIDFLNQIGRRSFEGANARNGTMSTSLVKHRASNSVVAPALSTMQIKEISKGVQNLYEIIRSSSNGMNVNRYSMEVGKELLKGAKGLEESLRMLVNLQEASEMMVKPQRKSRITLLEVDDEKEEDGRSKVVERNQVALPRFSFDKPSKRSNSSFSDGSGKVLTQQWSAAGDIAADTGSVRSVSYAKPTSEKGRISNVIAKLMGLEEVPVKVDSYPRRDENKKADDSRMNIVNTPSKPVKDSVIPQKVDPYPRLESYSKRGEVAKNEEIYKSTVKKTSKASNERKSQQFHDLNTNGESRVTQINKNNRADRVSQNQERQSNGEAKEKMHSKRRSLEVVEKAQAEKKKKAIRTEKSNEIKLVPRSNHIHEPERRAQKSRQDSQQTKPVKNTNLVSKELKPQPVEGNQKVKVSTPKAQEHEPVQQKMAPVARKKVDAIAVARIESPRTKEEVLRRRNRTINNLPTPLKHKLSVLKETNKKEVHIRSEPEEVKTIKANTESTTRSYDIVPICENETKSVPQITTVIKRDPQITHEAKSVPQITSEIVVAGTNAGILGKSNLSENKPKKAFYSNIQVALTEQEKQLKEILIKDQLFLSTAEALFKLNIPVGFLHVEDHNHHNNETKLKLDCGYEILKRKARSQELAVHPYVKPSIGSASIRYLDELVKQLYKDLEGVRLYGKDMCNKYDENDYLHHMLEKDIHSKNPDINSFWDFGWHITTFTFVEKDEFVCDVEQDMVCRLVDEIVDDLLSM